MIGASLRGKPRLPDAELARREALARDLIAQGHKHKDVERMSGLFNGRLAALVRREGLQYALPQRVRKANAERAERHARAVEMLRAGATSWRVQVECGLASGTVAALRKAHGLPLNAPGRVTQPRRLDGTLDHITERTHAELDALERRVAADRAAGRLPAIRPRTNAPKSGDEYLASAPRTYAVAFGR